MSVTVQGMMAYGYLGDDTFDLSLIHIWEL